MPWVNILDFYYSRKLLQVIAENYETLYSDGLPVSLTQVVTNPNSVAEFKADFDHALNEIGRGKWRGYPEKLRGFGKFQRLIISDIYGLPIKINYAPQLLGRAYGAMARVLNRKTNE